MELIDELEARTAARLPGTPCFVGRALEMLPKDVKPQFVVALERRNTITATVISDWLRDAYQIEVGDQSIRKHRNGKCRCRSSKS